MTDLPETRYARSGDVHIAYQVIGSGPDLLLVPPTFSHLEMRWDDPPYARMLHRLASFSRFISVDRRGGGLSDRVAMPTLEEEVQDLLAVLDEVGSLRPFVFGGGEGGALALFFAATHPSRTAGVVTYAAAARLTRSEDYPLGVDPEVYEQLLPLLERGELRGLIAAMAPGKAGDDAFIRQTERLVRSALSPAGLVDYLRSRLEIDIRNVLPTISVPVLVLHRAADPLFSVEHRRYLAEHIPDARYVELPGNDYPFWIGEVDTFLEEIEEFVTGARPIREADRRLATVLFTDVVGSTEQLARSGDRAWRDLLDRHDALMQQELARFGGRQVKTTGDGVLATFDGPARAIRGACAIRDAVARLGIDIRAGLHTGEIELRGDDVAGIAVNIAQRVSSLARSGEVLVSRTVTDLVAGSGLEFEDRGSHELKGVPGRWQLYAVSS